MSTIIDLYCGASGASTGIEKAFKKVGKDVKIIGVNHWKVAIQTSNANHVGNGSFFVDDLDRMDPLSVQNHINSSVDILWSSPTCIHFSKAAGGVPRSDQLRSQPMRAFDWIRAYRPKAFIMENVPEFVSWGPLYRSGPKSRIGKPIPSRKGATFNLFFSDLKKEFKYVEWKILCCANYGDATTRERFFLQAKNTPIKWPEKRKVWISAKEIIDWSIPGKSIFTRKKSLAEATLKRIEHGLLKYGGKPFISILRGQSNTRDLDSPLPTLTTGQHMALVQPFLIKYYGNSTTQSINEPLGTVTTKDRFALIQCSGGDIKYRMLTPKELARAHSFPKGFIFKGNKTETVKMIGNSVPVNTAKALALAAIS